MIRAGEILLRPCASANSTDLECASPAHSCDIMDQRSICMMVFVDDRDDECGCETVTAKLEPARLQQASSGHPTAKWHTSNMTMRMDDRCAAGMRSYAVNIARTSYRFKKFKESQFGASGGHQWVVTF